MRVLILTALQLEFLAVQRHLGNRKPLRHASGTIYEEGVFQATSKAIPVLLCQTGAGNTRAALEAERAIDFFLPSHALFVGVAGGLKDVALGDVVAATKVYGYESGKAEEVFRPRPEIAQSSYAIVQHAWRVSREGKWKLRVSGNNNETARSFVGPIAAGEKVVASLDSAVLKLLRATYGDALAVEMEGFGILTAVHASDKVQSLVIRGISDLIAGKSQADAGGSQQRAADNAAAFAFEMIESIAELGRRTFTEDELWESLGELVIQLYPKGPDDTAIWSRSGGDPSSLPYATSPRGAWHIALRTLRLGGGGNNISPMKLLLLLGKDFPSNKAVQELIDHWP